jgi:hypothetical protein
VFLTGLLAFEKPLHGKGLQPSMKTLLIFFIVLAISPLASAQDLRLQDGRVTQRTLVLTGTHYLFSDGIGGARFEGEGTISKLGECRLRLTNTTPTHSIVAEANPCNQTGVMVLYRFVPDGFIEYKIFDKTSN